MKIYQLSIPDVIDLMKSKEDPCDFVNTYLINLISNKIIHSKEELAKFIEKNPTFVKKYVK